MKEAFYFSHDNNARNDERILELRAEFGWEGYGIYWAVIESLAEASHYKLKLSSIKLFSICLAVDKQLLKDCLNLMFDLDLLIKNETYFWSESLLKRMKLKDEIREKRRISGKKGGEQKARNEASAKKNVALPNKKASNKKETKTNKKENKTKTKAQEQKIKNLFFLRFNIKLNNGVAERWLRYQEFDIIIFQISNGIVPDVITNIVGFYDTAFKQNKDITDINYEENNNVYKEDEVRV